MSQSIPGLIVGYVFAGIAASGYYLSKADADDSGTTTKAEYDTAVEGGNSLITSLLAPGMIVGEEIFAALDMIADAEPSV